MKNKNLFYRLIFEGVLLNIMGFGVGEFLPFYLATFIERGQFVFYLELSAKALIITFTTIILFRVLLLWLYARWAKRQNTFRIVFVPSKKQVTILVLVCTLFIILSTIVPHTPGVVRNWNGFRELFGISAGTTIFTLQYIYYFLEGLLIIWIIDIFQKAGEIKNAKTKFIWGGVGLALTWGFSHVFSKGIEGLIWAMPFGIVMGILYLIGKKNIVLPLLLWMAWYIF